MDYESSITDHGWSIIDHRSSNMDHPCPHWYLSRSSGTALVPQGNPHPWANMWPASHSLLAHIVAKFSFLRCYIVVWSIMKHRSSIMNQSWYSREGIELESCSVAWPFLDKLIWLNRFILWMLQWEMKYLDLYGPPHGWSQSTKSNIERNTQTCLPCMSS